MNLMLNKAIIEYKLYSYRLMPGDNVYQKYLTCHPKFDVYMTHWTQLLHFLGNS